MAETHCSTPTSKLQISIILPIHNAEKWLRECLMSVAVQKGNLSMELSAYNDASTDCSMVIFESCRGVLEKRGICVTLGGHCAGGPRGVGYAKNRAVAQSSGCYLCFLDADDVMHEDRIAEQYQSASDNPDSIIGCQFYRQPEGSTERYTNWANSLSLEQLISQSFTSHGPTVIMPTWFMAKETFELSGPFDEAGKGTPEDLIFFFRHLERGGKVVRVEKCLLMYRYHPDAETFSVKEDTIWHLRVEALQKQVLAKWTHFSIWNAGKQGRHLYRSLSKENQDKVTCFCDVDAKKIAKGYYCYEDSEMRQKPRIPIVHFSKAQPPIVICVKQDLTGGGFENNLASLHLTEGLDYIHFN